jgi:hypothetical protein
MGSLTNTASLNIMKALFPGATSGSTSLTSASSMSDSTALKIYNRNLTDTNGIYSANLGGPVIHQMTLITGGTSATGNPAPSPGLGDGNVLANTLSSSPGVNAGTLEFATFAKYPPLSGSIGGSVAMVASGAWSGWTLSTVGNKGQAANDGSITFPTFNGGTPIHIWGWCISAIATAAGSPANPHSLTALVTGSPTLPTILAYGDLSFARTVSQGDTPSFTSGAVVLALD